MLDMRKAGFDQTADARVILLRPVEGLVYDIWIVHYSLLQIAQNADNDDFQFALSISDLDQRDDANVISIARMTDDPSVFFTWGAFYEKASDVGVDLQELSKTFTLVKPYTVHQLAVSWQESMNSAQATAEVFFEQRRSPGEALFLANRQRSLG